MGSHVKYVTKYGLVRQNRAFGASTMTMMAHGAIP